MTLGILALGAWAIVVVWLVAIAEHLVALRRSLTALRLLLEPVDGPPEAVPPDEALWAHTAPCGEPRPPSPTG